MPDGVSLAARVWLPESAPPGPAVLEFLPYRKRDGTRGRDETLHPVFAANGYPGVRADVRGTGDSGGILFDEYDDQEIADGLALVGWIAAQPWCDGRVVLFGKSWGGINALMIAAERPPGLAGVVSVCATDDRYGNDAHYMGGRLLTENLIWGVGLMAVASHPPDPRLFGPSWRDQWLRRLEAVRPFPAVWMASPRRDGYWESRAACTRLRDIECPVWVVGGTEDPYRDSMDRMLACLGGPRTALLGPWAHLHPHLGRPGPPVDFPPAMVRWLDRHLRSDATPPTEPAMVAYVTEGPRGGARLNRLGRWIALDGWPGATSRVVRFGLEGGRLREGASAPGLLTVHTAGDLGLASGGWCRFGVHGEGPFDQREDDRRSATFDTDPLPHPLDVVGRPILSVTRADAGPGLLAARLCEVYPDGRSERVAYGIQDLASAGQRFDLPLELTAHRLRPGNRLRLALSSSLWPIAWPMPGDGPVHLVAEGVSLSIPTILGDPGARFAAHLPHALPTLPHTEPGSGFFHRSVDLYASTEEVVLRVRSDVMPDGEIAMGLIADIGVAQGYGVEEELAIQPGDPASARGEVQHRFRLDLEGRRLEGTATGRLSSADGALRFEGALEARENGETVFERRWRGLDPA
jgi:putative CocE/NonD family hydrolase